MRDAIRIAAIAASLFACTPAARAPELTSATASPAATSALLDRHFAIINELDPAKRLAAMNEVYADDIAFFDPGAPSHGRAAVAAAYAHLHERFPGAVFHRDSPIQDRDGMIRVAWALGRPGEAPVHRGEDVMRIEDNRIRAIWVYLQPDPPKSVFDGIEHTGVTVPDLAAAKTFFHDVMGCETVTTMGAFKTNDDWLHEHLGVDARAEVAGIAMMRCGHGSNLELLEYKDRTRREERIGNADLGAAHLAFYASDLKAAVAHLKAHGIATMGEPFTKTSGDTAGETFVYFRAPWGLQLELTSAPAGKAYEKERQGIRLWSPLQPAE